MIGGLLRLKAVFEEINGDVAVFIVDDVQKPYFVSVSDLPDEITLGDVYEVEIAADEKLRLLKKLPKERKRREESAKSKREALLKRSQNKKE